MIIRSNVVKHELMVGVFVGVGLLIAAGVFLKKTRETGLLDTRQVTFVVPHGSGLQEGGPVVMKGIRVGSVARMTLTDDHEVEVVCDISPRFASRIMTDSEATVLAPPLIGNTKVEISPAARARSPARVTSSPSARRAA